MRRALASVSEQLLTRGGGLEVAGQPMVSAAKTEQRLIWQPRLRDDAVKQITGRAGSHVTAVNNGLLASRSLLLSAWKRNDVVLMSLGTSKDLPLLRVFDYLLIGLIQLPCPRQQQ